MSDGTPVQPTLGELMARFLSKQADAHAAGLAAFDPASEVHPFEAGPVQPIDAKLAWDEAVAALQHARTSSSVKSRRADAWQAPPHWPAIVAAHEPIVALALAAGNFPQLVRNFHMVLERISLAGWKPSIGRPIPVPALEEWSRDVADRKLFPQALVAVGALRLAKQFDSATALVGKLDASVPADWRCAWDNEKAALLWHRGQTKEARSAWHKMEPTVAVLFNRGMADLFLGDAAAARLSLEAVALQIPETSAWHHLAKLYLVLAAG